jgi:phenylacetate-coenzyme A ligase PaaK-like adenylate-forming protein
MDYRKRLFSWRDPFDIEGTEALFVQAMRESLQFHIEHCTEYARILQKWGFTPRQLCHPSDLHQIPPLPTLYLKSHRLLSVKEKALLFRATSSGTSGRTSFVGLDRATAMLAFKMVWRIFSYRRLLSPIPTNYIVLGYELAKENRIGAAQTAFGATLAAPALHREYALKKEKEGYRYNPEGMIRALARYQKMGFPVRFMGFPAYLYHLLLKCREQGVRFRFSCGSRVMLAGGWKQFSSEAVERAQLYGMIQEILGIGEDSCIDFFGAVEHPIVYCDCKHHHFHVPVYSRVIIRDVKTLRPVPNGSPGLLNLLTPLMGSMPLHSVITDDLAILHDGEECECGLRSPYIELLGRAGLQEIKTCAAGAAELLEGVLQ